MHQACGPQSPLVCMKQEGELASTQTPATHVSFPLQPAVGLQLSACSPHSTALSAYHLLCRQMLQE